MNKEILDAHIHAIGIGLSIAALVLLLTIGAENVWQTVSYAIYGSSLIILFSMSTIYHSLSSTSNTSKKIKRIFHKLDHAAIYLLIAWTYTPFTLGVIRWWWGWTLFWIIWWLGIVWILFKLFYFKEWKEHRLFSTLLYVIMWWLFLIALPTFYENIPSLGMMRLFIGWWLYTAWTYFYINRSFSYSHTLWHIFVLAASICHFLWIYWYV